MPPEYYPMFDVLGRLTQIREAKGLSIYRLAKLSGIPQPTIATWYQKQYYPPIDKLEILCHTMGISLVDFFNTDPDTVIITDPDDYRAFELYRLLPGSQKELMVQLMENLLSSRSIKEHDNEKRPEE